ncbi:hypothetical protein RB195_019305 [Necator americanus]|uniref:SH3 domain-containing protein n=2 Tax=Necator americanus TaxID=51031 RepID=A0ABR1CFT3_NECAM
MQLWFRNIDHLKMFLLAFTINEFPTKRAAAVRPVSGQLPGNGCAISLPSLTLSSSFNFVPEVKISTASTMSLFNRILSIGDVLSRLPQLDAQVDKLEAEDSISHENSQLRRSFTRRCHELYKQIEEHKKRIRDVKAKESTEEQRMTALEQLEDLQIRLLRLAPERDRPSDVVSRSSEGETSGWTTDKSTREKTPITSPQPQVPIVENRRTSVMYDAASQDEEEEEDEEDEEEEDGQGKEKANAVVRNPGKNNQDESQPKTTKVSHLPPHPQPRIERRAMSSASSSPESRGVSGAVVPARSATGDAQFRSNAAKSQTRGAAVVDSVFIVLASLKAAESGDLTINEGERLRIVQTRPDGWWTAQNASGKRGLVPKTYLRQLTAVDDENGVRDYSAEQRTRAARTVSGSSADVPQPNPLAVEQIPRRARCLGDAQQLDPHLSFACHLTPRLSHSNIGFHDLYWNYQDDKLRKRRVRVSKLVRLIRLEGMPKESAISLIRTALYDRSRKTGRQIVSNVHTVRSQVKNRTWTFNTRTDTTSSGVDYGDFIVRSNYNMDDVVLLIEASHVVQGQEGLEERSLGIITIPLIANDTVVITNKTYSEFLRGENVFDRATSGGALTECRIVLKVLDVPQELVPYVDSMPDVLLFNPMFVRLYFFFRRRAGTTLLRDRDNPLSAEMLSDPLLALFPYVADQPDMMDHLRHLWNAKLKTVKNKAGQDVFHVSSPGTPCPLRSKVLHYGIPTAKSSLAVV